MRKGILANAPLFMPCFEESSSGPMSCINQKCYNYDIINQIYKNKQNSMNIYSQRINVIAQQSVLSAYEYFLPHCILLF
ncbi:hypothetical protein HZS_2715 [Henneguya salminicola]|nr:hypothetical protein HZS_2715 [Henneguya salminicola]